MGSRETPSSLDWVVSRAPPCEWIISRSGSIVILVFACNLPFHNHLLLEFLSSYLAIHPPRNFALWVFSLWILLSWWIGPTRATGVCRCEFVSPIFVRVLRRSSCSSRPASNPWKIGPNTWSDPHQDWSTAEVLMGVDGELYIVAHSQSSYINLSNLMKTSCCERNSGYCQTLRMTTIRCMLELDPILFFITVFK